MGDLGKAADLYEKAERVAKSIKQDPVLSDAYRKLGEIYKLKGAYDTSMKKFNKSLEIAQKTGHDEGLAEALRCLGYVNWRMGNFDKAEDFYKRALKIADAAKNKGTQGRIYIDLGNLANERGDLDKAEVHYNKSLFLLKNAGDELEMARAYNNLGDICIKRKSWEDGIKYFEKCNAIANRLRDQRWKGWSLFNAAECYSKSGNPKKAERNCHLAQRAIMSTQDKMAQAYVFMNYGIAYRFMEKWEQSEENFRKCFEILEELKSPAPTAYALIEYCEMLYQKGDKLQAIDKIKRAIDIYKKTGSHNYVQNLTKRLLEIKKSLSKA
jgi:tetratricopeptide (TPR) repeat protein